MIVNVKPDRGHRTYPKLSESVKIPQIGYNFSWNLEDAVLAESVVRLPGDLRYGAGHRKLLTTCNANEYASGSGTVAGFCTGSEFTCAFTADGSVYCFGKNDGGQLGYEDSNNKGFSAETIGANLPAVNVYGSTSANGAIDIACGDLHTCAVFDDGTAKCWGIGGDGRLGYNNQNNLGRNENTMGSNLNPIGFP
eukprot:3646731-Rhodomonas_salina.1